MKKVAYLLLFFLCSVQVARAEVSQFVFVTDPQTISPGIASETITIQSQNSSGLSEDITETFDIVFTSSSPGGVFLSTSGNPVSTTMSRNTSNKNFLYKDTTEGSHTLSIVATGRTSLATFSASQVIVVVNGSQANTGTSTGNTSQSNTSINTSSSQSSTNSAHSSPAPLSNIENKLEFEVSAGRDRLTSVGTTVTFEASPTRLQNISESSISYRWSFGDGSSESGNIVRHFYRFPGDYVVILNAQSSDKRAVSRVNVKVVSPTLNIAKVDDGVEISNKSSSEINMEEWKISDGKKSFSFPQDTIIASGKTLIFPRDITGVIGDEISLFNPIGKLYAGVETKEKKGMVLGISTSSSTIKFEEIQSKINEIKESLLKIKDAQAKAHSAKEEIVVKPLIKEVSPKKVEIEAVEPLLLNEEEAFTVLPQKKGNEPSWPMKGINFILGIFTED